MSASRTLKPNVDYPPIVDGVVFARVAAAPDTAANNATRSGDPGELSFDTDTGRLRVHDGVTLGGKIGPASYTEVSATTVLVGADHGFRNTDGDLWANEFLEFTLRNVKLKAGPFGTSLLFVDVDDTEHTLAMEDGVAGTYATISSLGGYLTTATAGTTYTPQARTISTTAPLTGGGDLSANRTIAIAAATASVNGYMTSVYAAKLDGIASGATANSSDATLLNRANHTGSPAQSPQSQQTLTDGATINWNMNSGGNAAVTLGGNRTLANPTNLTTGTTYTLIVKQDGTGSRTLTYGSNYKWTFGAAPVLSTAINSIDVLTFYYDGTNLYGTCLRSFA